MLTEFELANLASLYDKGILVPFIGSGMSRPACTSWEEMVIGLEDQAELPPSTSEDWMRRSQLALEQLRFLGKDLADAVNQAIRSDPNAAIPPQTTALASLYWPLVCTTNYDEIYLRAVLAQERALPQVLGRSEIDCRRVLQHVSLPATEALWTLQGFLGWRHDEVRSILPDHFNSKQFTGELVVGHVEYRRVANRAPHFRRCFAEIFRSRSLLFLGSGLTEPYFLSLFDEIIELVGPPAQPHFAIIENGRVDLEFMLRQYHIICRTYPKGEHQQVESILKQFKLFIDGKRNRPFAWSHQLASPSWAAKGAEWAKFTVIRSPLPHRSEIEKNEAIGISCGRGKDEIHPRSAKGVPLPSNDGIEAAGLSIDTQSNWLPQSDWVVNYECPQNVFGIVARELIDPNDPTDSRDRRSPDAIRAAFFAFLEEMTQRNIKKVHVQLLAAGSKKIFHPWVSLVQMARAYGEWHCWLQMETEDVVQPLNVNVYVVDPSAIAMLQGGYIYLSDQLQNIPMRVGVDIIHADGEVERYHQIVKGETLLGHLIPHVGRLQVNPPTLYTLPASRIFRKDKDFYKSIVKSVREFGLVSGGTLVVDYRPERATKPSIEREDSDVQATIVTSPISVHCDATSNDEVAVLKSMMESSYSLRSITGIAKETGFSKPTVNNLLTSLISKGLVSQATNSRGQLRWFATPEGRTMISNDHKQL